VKQFLRSLATVGVFAACFAPSARADVVLSGADSLDGTYSTSALQTAATTGGDSETYNGETGITVWGFLGGATGDVLTSTPAGDNSKNAILRYYALATNTSGQQSVISLGEIDPNFGGTAPNQAFIAYGPAAGGLTATPTLIVPGSPQRDVNNLASVQILAVPALQTGAGGQSTAVQLSGNVANPGSYNATALQTDFTPVTETTDGDTYTGVPLETFLDPTSTGTNEIVIAQGTDG
jgi:hypothetical protein